MKKLKYALDVQYNENRDAIVACIGFENWGDNRAIYSKTHLIENIEPYQAGSFYKRELPCLVEALKGLDNIEYVVVDGYVWLEEESHYGLGMYLYDALNKEIPIIGVAKNRFNNTPKKCELLRGESKKPLYITAIDMDMEEAKEYIANMNGKYRFPTLLKHVDSLARGEDR